MKIGIIGDTHFGAGFNLGKIDPDTQLNSRLLDFSNTFNSIIDNFLRQGVKLVVLTGDIFETRHPTSAQLNVFSRCLTRAVNKGLEIIIVVGNHDQQRTISTTTLDVFHSLELDNVSVYADMGLHTIKDDYGKNIDLFLMPYRDRRMLAADTNADAIEMISDELGRLRARTLNEDKEHCRIIVGHFMMGKPGEFVDPDSFSINELMLPLEIFEGFDATIMGHVHQHEVISKDPVIIYSGSMEKVSFGEKLHKKVSLILDTDNITDFQIIRSNVRALYEMSFDYTENKKLYKQTITDKIIEDIDDYSKTHKIGGAIVKFNARVKDNDLYHVNQNRIKSHILGKDVNYLSSVQIASVATRQLRNKDINEASAVKKAMDSFINGLLESDNVKKRLLKCAMKVMDEVDTK